MSTSVFTIRYSTKIYLSIVLFLSSLIACRPQSESPTAEVSPIQIQVVSWDFTPGRSRLAFVLFDGPSAVTDAQQVNLRLFEQDSDSTTAVWSGPAINYSDYEIPYWVAYPDIPAAGYWGVVAEVTQADSSIIEVPFIINVAESSLAPAVGQPAPPSQNRTVTTEPDLHKLSSANQPNPALYQMTVAEAIASHQPTVVAFATPGLCKTKWCAPVLDSVIAVQSEVGDVANFIHIEVYEDFQELTFVKEMAEWSLDTEPWIFVLDGNGYIITRFNGPISSRELSTALAPLIPEVASYSLD